MPITRDEFTRIDEDANGVGLDLSRDTTQGRIYRFLLENADKAFRQKEIAESVDVPRGSIGPTLKRLEGHGLLAHRERYWTIADAEHASASAGSLGATTADEIDGGFSDADVERWMETAVEPITEGVREDRSEDA